MKKSKIEKNEKKVIIIKALTEKEMNGTQGGAVNYNASKSNTINGSTTTGQ
jgi:hypothetical protein